MTSLSRRKRQTTARRTTPARTIASLLGIAWLAAGTASATDSSPGKPAPPALYPLHGQVSPPVSRDAPVLMPVITPTMPPAGPTLYYQKDPSPAKSTGSAIPAVYQAPDAKLAPPTPEAAKLPKSP